MDINFELYKVFYHVAFSLSFSAASASLYISQSAVSQSIKLLEEKLGCRLFIRSTKQVKLTQEGELLYQHISQAVNHIRTGQRSIAELNSLRQGDIRIGASDTICKYHLLPELQKFHRLYPDIKIHVTNRTSPQCLELLKNGAVDLVVVNVPGSGVDRRLTVHIIKTVHDIFIAGPNFAHLKNRELSLQDLTSYPLLMLEKNTTTRDFLDSFLEKKGIRLTPEIELESVDLLIELAKIGLGISFVLRDYVKKELAGKDVFALKIKEKLPPRRLGVVTNKSIPLPPAAAGFLAMLTGQARAASAGQELPAPAGQKK